MLIDTHKAIEKMIAVGLDQKQAETITDIISNIDQQVATKSDIFILKSEIKSVKSEINSIRSEIGTIKWMLGLLGALNLMILSIILSGKF